MKLRRAGYPRAPVQLPIVFSGFGELSTGQPAMLKELVITEPIFCCLTVLTNIDE